MDDSTKKLIAVGAGGLVLGFLASWLLSKCRCKDCPGSCRKAEEPKKTK